MTLRKLIPIIVATTALFCMAAPSAHACRRVVVRQGDDLVKVFSGTHTKYVIKDNLDLKGKKVKIGEGCTLVFQGGSLANGIVVGNNTKIKADNYEIFKRGYTRFRAYVMNGESEATPPNLLKEYHDWLIVDGTWNNRVCKFNWTGLQNNSNEDVMLAIRNFARLHTKDVKIVYPTINAQGYESINLPSGHNYDFGNSTISYPENLSDWEDKSISIPKGARSNPLESNYGLLSLGSRTIISNLAVDGKSVFRQAEKIRLGVSCIISLGNAQQVTLEKIDLSNVLGPAVTAQSQSKNITFRNCRFYNIGEHVMYSHQYLGYCHFEGCTFDTWDSERISVYRNGLNYIYKHSPPADNVNATYDEIYRFELKFVDCLFNNPKRVNSQGRTLGGFITGTFPLSILIENSTFTGAYPAFNLGGSEKTGKVCRMIVRNCNGAPYVYPSKANSDIITEFYDCINIPFRVVYAKRYEGCELYLDLYEDNIENVSPLFQQEFSGPLLINNCKFIDSGRNVKINHPLFHRPVVFENCIFSSNIKRKKNADVLTVKTNNPPKVSFYSCEINIPYYRLVGGCLDSNTISLEKCRIKQLIMN